MLRDDHSHMGGSYDMKSDAVIVEIVWSGDFIFMFLGLDVECTLWVIFITFIYHII